MMQNCRGKAAEIVHESRDVDTLSQPNRLSLISRLELCKLSLSLFNEVCNLQH